MVDDMEGLAGDVFLKWILENCSELEDMADTVPVPTTKLAPNLGVGVCGLQRWMRLGWHLNAGGEGVLIVGSGLQFFSVVQVRML